MKQGLGLMIGILVGVAGALLFSKSLPPEEGSPEEVIEVLQLQLRRAEREVRVLEDDGRSRGGRSTRDEVRDIVQDIREGKEVSLDDVFATMKPWMRDMSPLYNRMRELNEEDWADNLTGEWTRKYNLSDSEQARLKEWFKEKSRERGEEFQRVVESDTSGFVDYIRATEYDWRDAQGSEELMEGFLEGEELTQFREEQLENRIDSVQGEANRNLTRLDNIVELDEGQQDEVFGILARGSDDYRPGMDFDGMGGETNQLNVRARDEAIRRVLRPEQVERLNIHQAERKEEAERDMRRFGMTLPKDWDLLEGDSF